jgi:hypothetical protein
MMIRGICISQWSRPRDIEKLVRRLFPGTLVQARAWGRHGSGGRRCRISVSLPRSTSYEDIRALADEIETAVPPKAAVTFEIECLD